MPAPTDVPSIKGTNPETGEEEFRHSSDSEPFAALAFKIATDPFVGKLCFFRVYSGTVTTGSTVYNATKDCNERLGRILQMHSNHRKDIDCVYAGDIAATIGLKNTTTGDTLCDAKAPIILESMEFPDPVIRVAIEPKTKAGQEKMAIALAKLAEEDPTFKCYTDEETGQTIIAGMGELHLEIIVDRLLREFKVEANVGKPQVAYRETITKPAESDTKYSRQSGGRGQYGHVKIRIEPNPEKGYEFVNEVVGGAIPKEYIGPAEAGIKGAMQSGVLAGLSRGRLLRNGVQDRRFYGVQGCDEEGSSRAHGAHHEGRHYRPRGLYGRCYRRCQLPPRTDRRHRDAYGRSADQCIHPAVEHVRLRYHPSFQDAGTRSVCHGAQPLRRGSEVHC